MGPSNASVFQLRAKQGAVYLKFDCRGRGYFVRIRPNLRKADEEILFLWADKLRLIVSVMPKYLHLFTSEMVLFSIKYVHVKRFFLLVIPSRTVLFVFSSIIQTLHQWEIARRLSSKTSWPSELQFSLNNTQSSARSLVPTKELITPKMSLI